MSDDRADVVPMAGGGGTFGDLAMQEVRFNWGDAYEVGTDDETGKPWALRRDGLGGAIIADDPAALRRLISADYGMRPVPRDLPGTGAR